MRSKSVNNVTIFPSNFTKWTKFTEYWIHFKWTPPSCSFTEFMWQKAIRHERNGAEGVDTQIVDENISMEYLHKTRNTLILFEPNVDFEMTNSLMINSSKSWRWFAFNIKYDAFEMRAKYLFDWRFSSNCFSMSRKSKPSTLGTN